MFCLHPLRLVVVFLLLAPAWARGQAPADSVSASARFIGFRAGYSQYTMTGTHVTLLTGPGGDQVVPVAWATAGAVARVGLHNALSVQGELLYVRQGGGFAGQVFYYGRSTYTVDCLQVPLLLDLRLGGTAGPSLHLQGGPAFVAAVRGVQVDASSLAAGNRFNNPSTWWALAYGAELAWARDRRVYTLTARWTQDLDDFYQRDYQGRAYNARSHGFSLTAGLLFAR